MLLVGIGCFVGAYLLVNLWHARPHPHPFDQVTGVRMIPPDSGGQREDVLVLIVSAYCGASKDPRLPSAWRSIVEAEAKAAPLGARAFRTIGVAVANPAGVGVSFLEGFGAFDEVASGRGWEAMGGMVFFSDDLVGPMAVPQIIEMQRTVIRSAVGGLRTEDIRVLRRWIGVDQILILSRRHTVAKDR